jgi:hypothetical protein
MKFPIKIRHKLLEKGKEYYEKKAKMLEGMK